MAKNKDAAKSEGHDRGLNKKPGSSGITQGWNDDKAARDARREGFEQGKRERARIDAEKKSRK
jgi:hypothetical protein